MRPTPKTATIRGVAACQHPFTVRVTTPEDLAGRTGVAATAQYAYWRATQLRASEQGDCRACITAAPLTRLRADIDAIATWLQVEPLHRLDGSVRTVLAAETVRATVLARALSHTLMTTWDPGASAAVTLAFQALRQQFPAETWLPPKTPVQDDPLAARLAAAIPTITSDQTPALTAFLMHFKAVFPKVEAQRLISVWLCLRNEWEAFARTFSSPGWGDEPSFWLRHRTHLQATELVRVVELEPLVVFEAAITAQIQWTAGDEAITFHRQMRNIHLAPHLIGAWRETQQPPATLREAIELADIEAALSPAPEWWEDAFRQ